MGKLFVFILFFCIVFIKCDAQSLIEDGGFENVSFNQDKSEWLFEHWVSLTGRPITTDWGPKFSIYKIALDTKKENLAFFSYDELIDLRSPYEGDCCLDTYTVYLRNLFQSKLLRPLKKDSTYCLSFFYKIVAHNIPYNRVENVVSKNLGVFFTKNDLSNPKIIKSLNNLNIPLHFDYYIDNFKYEKRNKWIKFEINFKAKSDYSYFIIGNNDALVSASELRPFRGISCKFDNISLRQIQISKNETLNTNDTKISIKTLPEVNNSEQVINILKAPLPQSDSVIKYYQFIDRAENLIIEKKYKEAFAEYCNAFNYKIPFIRDYLNAGKLITNYKVMDSLLIRKFLIVSQKVNPNRNPINKRIEYLQNLDSIFQTSYINYFKKDPSLQNIAFAGKIDSSLIFAIDSIMNLDQSSRILKNKIDQTDASNYDAILRLYNNNKEISELTVGKSGMTILGTIFLHFSRYESRDWIQLLQNEVLKGKFNNRVFAFLVDSYIENNIESDPTKSYFLSNIGFAHYRKYLIPQIDHKTIARANNRRQEIYLEPIESQQRKQIYNFRHTFDEFEFYQFFTFDPFFPEKDVSEERVLPAENNFIEGLISKYPNLLIFEKQSENYDIDFK